jgi:DNA-binding protein Fis
VSRGNRTRAAELLGISVRTLRNKLNGPSRDEAATRTQST